jgi:hypothetical protein
MSKSNQESSKQVTISIAKALIVQSVTSGYQLAQPITAQKLPENIIGNQTGNQTGGSFGLELEPSHVERRGGASRNNWRPAIRATVGIL